MRRSGPDESSLAAVVYLSYARNAISNSTFVVCFFSFRFTWARLGGGGTYVVDN